MRHFWNSTVWLGPGGKGWEKVEYWILFASRHIRPTAQISAVKFHCTLGILVVGNACDFPEFSQQALSESCLKGCKKPIGKGTVKDNNLKKKKQLSVNWIETFFFLQYAGNHLMMIVAHFLRGVACCMQLLVGWESPTHTGGIKPNSLCRDERDSINSMFILVGASSFCPLN